MLDSADKTDSLIKEVFGSSAKKNFKDLESKENEISTQPPCESTGAIEFNDLSNITEEISKTFENQNLRIDQTVSLDDPSRKK